MSATVLQAASRPDPKILLRRAQELIAGGRAGAGRPLLSALERMGAEPAAVAELRGRLALQEDRPADAAAGLDAAIAATPGDAALHRRRAEARGRLGRYGEAARDAAEAVLLEPGEPAGRALLGVMLLQLDHLPEACACLADAVARRPDNVAFRLALADAQETAGRPDAAAATLEDGVGRTPRAAALRTRLALLHAHGGDWPRVLEVAEAARADGVSDAAMFGLNGQALATLRRDGAGEAFADALKLAPHDAHLRHLAAASGAIPCADRAPATYVRALFDGCAARYEALAIAAGDRVPGLIRAAVEADLPLPSGPVLDLGCGTGLMGVAVHDLGVGRLVGVDVSPRMIAQASPRGIYDEMHATDLVDHLSQEARRFALVLAADVLCYFGDLRPLLGLVRPRLQEAGLFAFSVELADAAAEPGSEARPGPGPGRGWTLLPTGRYAHEPAYVAAEAERAGFDVVSVAPEILRREPGGPVMGLIVMLARGPDAG